MIVLLALGAWCVVSVPVGLAVGAFIRAGGVSIDGDEP